MKAFFDDKTIAVLGFLIIAIPVLWWLISKGNRTIKKQHAALYKQYQQALKSGDKQAALQAGRRYYSAVRGGRLTIYDEQALTNDLAAMK
jgi:hypothetical protein